MFVICQEMCWIIFSWLMSILFIVFADKRLQVFDDAEKPVTGCLLALFSPQMVCINQFGYSGYSHVFEDLLQTQDRTCH